jgi:hypothetical protein
MSRASFQTRMRVSTSAIISSSKSRSPPAENALPAPVSNTAFTLASASMTRQISVSWRCISPSTALSLSGLFMMTRSTPACGRSISSREKRA